MTAELNVTRIEPRISPDPISEPDWLLTTMDGDRVAQSMRYGDADIAEHGIERVQGWVTDDRQRYDAWRRDEWWFVDLRLVAVVEVSADGHRIGTLEIDGPALGGIESDAGDEYMVSVVGELFEEFKPDLAGFGFDDGDSIVPTEIVCEQ